MKDRKRLCLNNQLVDPSCVNLIHDLCSPMPVIHQPPASQWLGTSPRSSQSTAEDKEGQVSFPTPKTPSYKPHHDSHPLCPPFPVLPFTVPAKRRRRVQSQKTCKRPKKITSYFTLNRRSLPIDLSISVVRTACNKYLRNKVMILTNNCSTVSEYQSPLRV